MESSVPERPFVTNVFGRFLAPAPVSPSFFPLVFLFAFAAYDLTCSPLSKRMEQANNAFPALAPVIIREALFLRRFPRPSRSMYFGDVSEANRENLEAGTS